MCPPQNFPEGWERDTIPDEPSASSTFILYDFGYERGRVKVHAAILPYSRTPENAVCRRHISGEWDCRDEGDKGNG